MDQTAESKASKDLTFQKNVSHPPSPIGHKGRIIIRNLVFDINEKMLRKLMSQFGEIIDVRITIIH